MCGSRDILAKPAKRSKRLQCERAELPRQSQRNYFGSITSYGMLSSFLTLIFFWTFTVGTAIKLSTVPSLLPADVPLVQNFLNTPDGRKGWASWLLDQGYTVYLLDQISRGRSSYHRSNGPTITYTAELAEKRWTACRDFQLWPEAALHMQWPGSGRVGDPIFDAYYASTVPSLKDYGLEQTLMQVAGSSLLDRIGPAILVTHSQGGTHGWLWADVRPELVKAIVAIEPSGPPFQSTIVKNATVKLYGITDIPMSFDPPADATIDGKTPLQTHEEPALNGRTCILQQEPARILKNLSKIPVLLETGEASSHASYDDFTVRFLRQAGVNVKRLKLANEGIHGNGYLQFLEKNNLEIIELLERWIKTIG